MITCIAIDDEPLALEIINQYSDKISFLDLKKTFTNTDEALKYLNNNPVDLLFLDIRMPDINGIHFYKSLSYKPMLILTTAYKDYALDGFNVDALDYLLKPVEFERFNKAALKAKEYRDFLSSVELHSKIIYVKVNYEITKVNLADVQYIEALDDYIKIHTKPTPLLTLMTLKSMLERLPSKEFIRVHRSYIVAVNKIEKFSRNKVYVGGREIPIGSSYVDVYSKLAEITGY